MLRRIFDAHQHEPDLLAIGADWKQFSRALAQVRKRGVVMSSGELHPGRVGVSAPIFAERGRVIGGLTLIGTDSRVAAFREDYLCQHVLDAAADITRRLSLQGLDP
jgi:DNA-binding IclR family transcriptional regulator